MSGKIADFSNFQKLNSDIILAQFLQPKILVAKIEQDIFLPVVIGTLFRNKMFMLDEMTCQQKPGKK